MKISRVREWEYHFEVASFLVGFYSVSLSFFFQTSTRISDCFAFSPHDNCISHHKRISHKIQSENIDLSYSNVGTKIITRTLTMIHCRSSIITQVSLWLAPWHCFVSIVNIGKFYIIILIDHSNIPRFFYKMGLIVITVMWTWAMCGSIYLSTVSPSVAF